MSTAFEIPTQPQNQKFGIVLSGFQYNVTIRWNKFSSSWTMDVYDVDDDPLLLGQPLVTGCDLLSQLEYLGIGGQMVVQSDGSTDSVPTYDSLGSTGHLYYVVSDTDVAEQVTVT